jgi:hypothetical protein
VSPVATHREAAVSAPGERGSLTNVQDVQRIPCEHVCVTSGLELENDLIAAHILSTGKVTPAQFNWLDPPACWRYLT